MCFIQTSANYSTWYRYSKITWKSGNIQGRIPGQIGGKYPHNIIFEYVFQKLAFPIHDLCLPDFMKHARIFG